MRASSKEIIKIRECSFNMTRGYKDTEGGGGGGLRKFLDTRKGGSEKNVGLGGEALKFVYFKTNRRGGAPKKT